MRIRDKSGHSLTVKQREFVKAYCKEGSETFMSVEKSAEVANPESRDAKSLGRYYMRDEEVKRSIRDRLAVDDIDDLLEEGVRKRLQDPYGKEWQPTADYVSKLRGDFAPEKRMNLNMSVDEREERYQRVMELLEGKREEV